MTDKAYLEKGMSHLQQGEYVKALLCYQKAIKKNPADYANYWTYYEDCCKKMGLNIASKAFRSDMVLCLKKTIEAMEQGIYDKYYMGLRYQEMASFYFWNEEYAKAAAAASENLKSEWSRTESEIYEACSLHALGTDVEQKYEAVSADTIENIRDAICYEYRTEFPGATEEQLDLLCSKANGKLPEELLSFYRGIMLEFSLELSGISFLSFEELYRENTGEIPGSYLAELGFFVFAKRESGGLIFVDLKDESASIYQCEPVFLEEGKICLTASGSVELPLTYENVKQVSIKLALNLIHFFNSVYDCILPKANPEACISQYVLTKQLEKAKFKGLAETNLGKIRVSAENTEDNAEDEGGMTSWEGDVVRQLKMADKLSNRLEMLTSKPSVEMKPVRTAVGLKDCKVGGVPYIPVGDSYPTNPVTGEKLFLLLQLNFSQIPNIKGYPQKGILQIFITGYEDMGMPCGLDFTEPQKQEGWRILYYEDDRDALSKEEIMDMMPSMNETGTLDLPFITVDAEYGLEFKLHQMPMSIADYRFEQIISEECQDLLTEEMKEVPFYDWDEIVLEEVTDKLQADGCRLGGYSKFINGDLRPFEEETMDYELFVQLDSYNEDGEWLICFGDAGVANFFIHPADLQKKDFSHVLFCLDCY